MSPGIPWSLDPKKPDVGSSCSGLQMLLLLPSALTAQLGSSDGERRVLPSDGNNTPGPERNVEA